MKQLPDTTKVAFQNFFNTVRGRARAFYMIDFDGTTIDYVVLDFDDDPTETQRFNQNDMKKLSLKSQLTA